MPVISRFSFKTATFSRFLKKAIATSNFINEDYNGKFESEFIFSMLKETIKTVFLQSHWKVNDEIVNILEQFHLYRFPS